MAFAAAMTAAERLGDMSPKDSHGYSSTQRLLGLTKKTRDRNETRDGTTFVCKLNLTAIGLDL